MNLQRRVAGRAGGKADQPGRNAWQTLIPGDANPVHDGWPHVLQAGGVALPTYLTGTSAPLSYPLDGNGFYIRALPGFSAGEQSIKGAYKAMPSPSPQALMIIDAAKMS